MCVWVPGVCFPQTCCTVIANEVMNAHTNALWNPRSFWLESVLRRFPSLNSYTKKNTFRIRRPSCARKQMFTPNALKKVLVKRSTVGVRTWRINGASMDVRSTKFSEIHADVGLFVYDSGFLISFRRISTLSLIWNLRSGLGGSRVALKSNADYQGVWINSRRCCLFGQT